jgi:lysozyme
MTLAQLKASRATWRAREVHAYRMWRFYRYKSKADKATRLAKRKSWYDAYIKARDARRARDKQIARKQGGAHEVSDGVVALIKQFEGFSSHPYRDAVGVWTIGYGETAGINSRTSPWSESYASQRLRARLNRDYAPSVLAANKNLKQNQFDGFVSFVYNVGTGGVSSTTRVGRYLRSGDVRSAADAILAWNKAGGRVLLGLDRRRHAERALILR